MNSWHRFCNGGYLFVKVALASYMCSLSECTSVLCLIWEFDYVSSQVVACTWMRFKRALLRRPLICIGTNNMFQLGMLITKWVLVQLPKTFRPGHGHASDINQPTRPPIRSSRCQPPQPVLELGDVCPCIFFIDGHFLQNPNPTNRVKLS